MATNLQAAWQQVRACTRAVQAVQTQNGLTFRREQGEVRALVRQQVQAQQALHQAGTAYLAQYGYTAGGRKRK